MYCPRCRKVVYTHEQVRILKLELTHHAVVENAWDVGALKLLCQQGFAKAAIEDEGTVYVYTITEAGWAEMRDAGLLPPTIPAQTASATIQRVLDANAGLCLDDEAERSALAQQIAAALQANGPQMPQEADS